MEKKKLEADEAIRKLDEKNQLYQEKLKHLTEEYERAV